MWSLGSLQLLEGAADRHSGGPAVLQGTLRNLSCRTLNKLPFRKIHRKSVTPSQAEIWKTRHTRDSVYVSFSLSVSPVLWTFEAK